MKTHLKLLLFSAALPLAAGAVPAQDAQQRYFCEEVRKPFFAARAGSGVYVPQRELAQLARFSMPKPPGVKRAFIVGESVAVLLGAGNTAAARERGVKAWLARNFRAGPAPEKKPGMEVINCGMGGYESRRINDIAQEVLAYGPDLLVVMSGNNERLESCPGASYELARRQYRLLERYYSLKAGPLEAAKLASLKMHRGMLERMARSAKKAGVPVVLCTLPANVLDMPPHAELPLGNDSFAAGYRLFHEKKYGPALEKFRAALARSPRDGFFNFYAGKALAALGRWGEARERLVSALENDPAPGRAVAARNTMIREVAAAEGACVADLDALFARKAAGRLPGFADFTDGVHWRPAHNQAVWEEIFRAAAACGAGGFEGYREAGVPDPADAEETARQDARKRLSYALTWLRPGGFSQPSLAELAYIEDRFPGLIGEASASPEALEGLMERNFWTIGAPMDLKGLFPLALGHFAETKRRAGKAEKALELIDRALETDKWDPLLRLERAQILAGLGRGQEAQQEFSRLIRARGARGREAEALSRAYGLSAEGFPEDGGQQPGR